MWDPVNGDWSSKFGDYTMVSSSVVGMYMKNMDVLNLEDDTTTLSHHRGMERLILYLVS